MSSRLVGAILALTAAALLAASIVTSAWWAGHPIVEGRTLAAKDVNVGLYRAIGCNTGGEGVCQKLELPDAFTATVPSAFGSAVSAPSDGVWVMAGPVHVQPPIHPDPTTRNSAGGRS